MKSVLKGLKSPYFLILTITCLAVLLRLYKLGEWSFWKDEIFTLSNKQDGLHLAILGESFARYLIQWTVSLLGTNEATARLAPAMIGALSVPALYFPIKTLYGSGVALLSSGMLAVSPWHIYWSQNARFYVLLLAFGSLSLLTLAISLEKSRSWLAVLSILFLFLAGRESLVALLLVPIMAGTFIILGLTSAKNKAYWHNRSVFILLALLVLVSVYFAAPYLKDLPSWLSAFGRINNTPVWILAATTYYVGVPIMCIAAFSAVSMIFHREKTAYLLILWAFLPLTIIIIVSFFHYSASRYIFISLPAFFILASQAANRLWEQTRASQAFLTFGFIAILLVTPVSEDALYFASQNGNREDGRAAYGYIRENFQPGDLVVSSDPEVGDYYMGARTLPMSEMATGIFKRYQRVWFVENMDGNELYPDQMTWIRDHSELVANFDVHASARIFIMRVYLYEVPKSSGQ